MYMRLLVAVSISLTAIAGSIARADNPLERARKAIEEAERLNRLRRNTPKPPPTPNSPQQQQQQQQQSSGDIPKLDAKVSEELMGPRTGDPVMSEDGNHLAIQTTKGSRQVILLDGVPGPVFDEVGRITSMPIQPQVVLSPTGGHSAYAGRRGGALIAVIDGKEAGTIATRDTLKGPASFSIQGWNFFFNHDGSKLAYPVLSAGGEWTMMVNGVKGTSYPMIDCKQTLLAGNRLVYVVQAADKKFHVVVDDKEGPPYDAVQSLQLSADGTHYAFVADSGTRHMVVCDGVEGQAYAAITDLDLARDGRVAYMATKPNEPAPQGHGSSQPWLVVGTAEISPDTQTFGIGFGPGGRPQRHVALASDGKRFACIKRLESSNSIGVFLDGKQVGPEYTNASDLLFSPDGKRFMFIGQTKDGMFPVVDGEELDGLGTVSDWQFSPDSKHYDVIGFANGVTTVIFDGKKETQFRGATPFVFSPDGSHHAFAGTVGLTSIAPVIDGQVQPGSVGDFRPRMNSTPRITWPSFVYSPDSKHLAYVSQKPESKATVLVDSANYACPTAAFGFPSFSPDSKHFAWITYTGQTDNLYVDGKAGPIYESMLETKASAIAFTDEHTVRFYGIKDNQIYRVRVDIGG